MLTRLETLTNEIIARQDDLAALTQDLIRMPTLNPPGLGYLEICEYLSNRLSKRGFETQLIRAKGALGDSDKYPRWNLVARHEGRHSGECIHFNSHIDVVETGHGWTVDPFGGELRDGRIYGRGACDMKGGLATSIIAAEAFIDTNPDYSGAIEISGTADEESGGYGGVAYLAEQGFFDLRRVHHVIIPEPLHKDRICVGHRGVWWAELETEGRIAHGSMPFLGECAVRHMSAVVQEMERSLWPELATRRSDHPIIPDSARQPTLNINAIHGGEPEQDSGYTGLPSACVPDRARMVIDRRFLPEENLPDVKQEMMQVLDRVRETRPGFQCSVRDLFEVLPSLTPADAPVVRTVETAIESVLGKAPDHVLSPGTYDQKHIDRIGKLKNCIAYGPGILDLAHQPDEYIALQDMVDSAQVMGHVLMQLLTDDLN